MERRGASHVRVDGANGLAQNAGANVKKKLTDDQILAKTERWHKGKSKKPLHEYLGMTWQEYKEWSEKPIPD